MFSSLESADMAEVFHIDTLEFELGESIWSVAETKEAKLRAITYYQMACEKNDGRAYLALYQINKEWHNSYLITGRQHNGLPYLNKSLELGYLPAFQYAASLDDIFSVYTRLIYLSIGLAVAHRTKHSSFNEFQRLFLNLSEGFASEFVPEILQIGQEWIPGDSIDIESSPLDGASIKHPTNYISAIDEDRSNWQIFSVKENLEEYLKQLPGSDEYRLAYEAEDKNDSETFELLMRDAAKKGNGQAIYALLDESNFTLIGATMNGSPDGFTDLMQQIAVFPEYWDFFNTSKLNPVQDAKYIARIDCLIYLYTLMERLGLANYDVVGLKIKRLYSDSDSGYFRERAYINELKYQLCDHVHVVQVNDRAYAWRLGMKFDAKFFEQLRISNGV
jgi:hypothetical protein